MPCERRGQRGPAGPARVEKREQRAVGPRPVRARHLAATAVGTIAAGAYGQAVLGGVMGDFLGATICVLELSIYLGLAADASRFDASAFLRLAVVVSLPQIYGRLDRGEKKAC